MNENEYHIEGLEHKGKERRILFDCMKKKKKKKRGSYGGQKGMSWWWSL